MQAAILSVLEDLVTAGSVDMIVHFGDIAYNMEHDEGRYGDAFLNMIQVARRATE